MSDIKFRRGQGGLGRPLPGQDHISAFIGFIPTANVPAGFDTMIKVVYSWLQARTLGLDYTSTDKDLALLSYSVFHCFERNKKAVVYINVVGAATNALDFTQVCVTQRFAEGKIRQVGITSSRTFVASDLTLIKAQRDIMEDEDMPLEVIYGADTSGVSDLSTLTDLRATLTAEGVSAVIGQDGGALGLQMFTDLGCSIPAVGTVIGCMSEGKVHQSIAWVERFNLAQNSVGDFDVPAFGNGDLYKSFAKGAIEAIDAMGYLFIRKRPDTAGSFWNDSHCACPITSDYAYIENNRVINKAVRGIRTFLTPDINAPLYVKDDGTLDEDTIATFKNDADKPLEQMKIDGELSAYETIIDPAQNVVSTSKIVVNPRLVPVGVAREIEVPIGFEVKLQGA